MEDRTLEVATMIAAKLAAHGEHTAVIGAVAAAVWNYPRATEDFDLATFTNPFGALAAIERELKAEGYDAELITPDADDPLGGVLRVEGSDFRTIEVVNFFNPLGKIAEIGRLAVDQAVPNGIGTLSVVQLPHLIALKLYSSPGAGGKGYADALELLHRNPDIDIDALRDLCEHVGLGAELDALLERKPSAT
ncbi:MAG TPA: hypothetical protein VGH28_19130 [Polyangiaceae bacterium]